MYGLSPSTWNGWEAGSGIEVLGAGSVTSVRPRLTACRERRPRLPAPVTAASAGARAAATPRGPGPTACPARRRGQEGTAVGDLDPWVLGGRGDVLLRGWTWR